MEVRKLFSQMSYEEIFYLWQLVKEWGDNTNKVKFAKHSMDRVRQKNITKSEVLETIASGACIELHIKGNSPRVLLRKQRWNQTYDICTVIDVFTGTVVTAYINSTNDTHDTLHEEIYDDELDVCSIMKKIKGRC